MMVDSAGVTSIIMPPLQPFGPQPSIMVSQPQLDAQPQLDGQQQLRFIRRLQQQRRAGRQQHDDCTSQQAVWTLQQVGAQQRRTLTGRQQVVRQRAGRQQFVRQHWASAELTSTSHIKVAKRAKKQTIANFFITSISEQVKMRIPRSGLQTGVLGKQGSVCGRYVNRPSPPK